MEGVEFTYDDWLDEINEWFLSDVCALEGCDNPLLGYKWNAIYCCDACRWKARDQTPERIAYYQSPERKASNKYWKAVRRAAKGIT